MGHLNPWTLHLDPTMSSVHSKVKQLQFGGTWNQGCSVVIGSLQGPGQIWWRQP
jgi:hypothetical protein